MLPVLHQISKQAAEAWILFVYWHQNIGFKRKLSPEGLMEEIGLGVRGVGWGVVSEWQPYCKTSNPRCTSINSPC